MFFDSILKIVSLSLEQLAADEYCGTGAEQDLRNIRKEYVAKGITFIAAAIGSDKEAIKRCYGEQCFLDITDCAIRS